MVKIYKLLQNKTVVYVGKTTQTLSQRFKQHKAKRNLDYTYTIELICEVEDEEAKEQEDYYIRLYNTRTEGLNKKFESNKPNTNYKTSKLINAEALAKSIIKNLNK